jgi:hypothetical protein
VERPHRRRLLCQHALNVWRHQTRRGSGYCESANISQELTSGQLY